MSQVASYHHDRPRLNNWGGEFQARSEPLDPPSHVHVKPRGRVRSSRLLLVKPAHAYNEILRGLGGHGKTAWADAVAKPTKSFLDPPDKRRKRVSKVCFGEISFLNIFGLLLQIADCLLCELK